MRNCSHGGFAKLNEGKGFHEQEYFITRSCACTCNCESDAVCVCGFCDCRAMNGKVVHITIEDWSPHLTSKLSEIQSPTCKIIVKVFWHSTDILLVGKTPKDVEDHLEKMLETLSAAFSSEKDDYFDWTNPDNIDDLC